MLCLRGYARIVRLGCVVSAIARHTYAEAWFEGGRATVTALRLTGDLLGVLVLSQRYEA
jgi:hypothetical protein